MAYYVPRLKKWGGNVPRIPYQIVPMANIIMDTGNKIVLIAGISCTVVM